MLRVPVDVCHCGRLFLSKSYTRYKFRSKAKVNVDTVVTDIPAWPTHRLGSSMWHR